MAMEGPWTSADELIRYSPLGIFSPGYQKVAQLYADMVADLEANRDEYSCTSPLPSPPTSNALITAHSPKSQATKLTNPTKRPNKHALGLQHRRHHQCIARDNDHLLLPVAGGRAQVRARAHPPQGLGLVEPEQQGTSGDQHLS
jgi:hypothetical protein